MYYVKFFNRVKLDSGEIVPPGRWAIFQDANRQWLTLLDRSVLLSRMDWYLSNLLGSTGPVWWIGTEAELQELDR